MSEVVVTGFGGTQIKKDVTGNIAMQRFLMIVCVLLGLAVSVPAADKPQTFTPAEWAIWKDAPEEAESCEG